MPARKITIDKDKVREMEVWICNTSDIYFNNTIPLIENFTRKYVRGTFDKNKAIKGFELIIPYGVKSYNKAFGYKMTFNKAEREMLARKIYDYYEDIMKEMFKKAKKLKK